jgi:uncharacterized protein (TIGR02118 family)
MKSISLLARRAGLTHEQFMHHWREVHGPLAHAVPGIRRYVQNEIAAQPTRPDIPSHEIEVDGIAEIWWESEEAMRHAATTPELKALHADGALFIGRIKSFVVREHTIIPADGPPFP